MRETFDSLSCIVDRTKAAEGGIMNTILSGTKKKPRELQDPENKALNSVLIKSQPGMSPLHYMRLHVETASFSQLLLQKTFFGGFTGRILSFGSALTSHGFSYKWKFQSRQYVASMHLLH